MSEPQYVLTVKEPYATGLVTGVILSYVHKLKLTGKKILVCVAVDKDLNDREASDVFDKLDDAPLTAKFYSPDTTDAELEDILTAIQGKVDSGEELTDDESLVTLLANSTIESDSHLGKIIGWIKFDDSEPVATRHRNFLSEYELFPEEQWKPHKGGVNLVPYVG